MKKFFAVLLITVLGFVGYFTPTAYASNSSQWVNSSLYYSYGLTTNIQGAEYYTYYQTVDNWVKYSCSANDYRYTEQASGWYYPNWPNKFAVVVYCNLVWGSVEIFPRIQLTADGGVRAFKG